MENQKSPVKSLGVLGGSVAVLVGFGQLFGIVVSPEDVASLANLSASLGTIAAGFAAVIGRVRADSKIKLPWS